MKRPTRLGEAGFTGWELIAVLTIGALITASIGGPMAVKKFRENCTKPTESIQTLMSTQGIGDSQPQIITPLPQVQPVQAQANPFPKGTADPFAQGTANPFPPGTANPFAPPPKAQELPKETGVYANQEGSYSLKSICPVWSPGVTSGSCTCHNSEAVDVINVKILQQRTRTTGYQVYMTYRKEGNGASTNPSP